MQKCSCCKDFKMFKNEIFITRSIIKQTTLLMRICVIEPMQVQNYKVKDDECYELSAQGFKLH
jgi:hypothetical protein